MLGRSVGPRQMEWQVFQTRIHGRGGQGVVTAAELLSVAAFDAGHHAQAFPSFGSERTGAPVVAYCRIADTPIRSREPIVTPDALVIQDVTLLRQVDVVSGLRVGGVVLVNSTRPVQLEQDCHVTTIPATEIALEHIGRPVPNVALLGGFVALTGVVSLEGLDQAIDERFTGALAAGNRAAARAAFEAVRRRREDTVDA